MTDPRIAPGQSAERTLTVSETHSARHLGSGSLRVFATPAMILLIEEVGRHHGFEHLPATFTGVQQAPEASDPRIARDARHCLAQPLRAIMVGLGLLALRFGPRRFGAELAVVELHQHRALFHGLAFSEAGRIVGIGQIKPYRSGRELGSLVVVSDRRQSGVGGAIIRALIERERGPLLLFCLAFREPCYAKFGFQRCRLRDLPGEFKLKYAMGAVFTRLVGRRLIVMQRPNGLRDV